MLVSCYLVIKNERRHNLLINKSRTSVHLEILLIGTLTLSRYDTYTTIFSQNNLL